MFDEILNGTAPDGTSFDLFGPEDAPAIALIHGLGLSRGVWTDHLPALGRKYRVLNYDLYGHGDSAPPHEAASLSVYSNQLASLMDHLEIQKASVIGFSIGGMINRRFAMDHSEKLQRLVILNSPHDRGEDAQKQVEERAAKVRAQGAEATLEEALKRWFTPDYLASGAGPESVRHWRTLVDPESYAQAAWVLANGVRELIQPATKITHPTLVMTCENDSGSTPKMSFDIAAEIPGAITKIVPELQHLGLMEKPEAFTQPILNFLEGEWT